jgi:hypothetical protein
MIGAGNQASYAVRRVLIESLQGGTDVFVSEGTLNKTQVQIPNAPGVLQTAYQDNRRFEGWKNEPYVAPADPVSGS